MKLEPEYKPLTFQDLRDRVEAQIFGPDKKRKITVFSDLELHDDGTLHLDGVSVRDSEGSGEGLMVYIKPEHVVGFLESAAKLQAQLKKLGLLPKPVKKVDKVAGKK